MAANGWIKWYRQAESNKVLKDEFFDKYHAFLYLVEHANHEDATIPFGSETTTIKRGQLHTSVRKLAREWNWSEGKVRRFLGTLTGAHMVGISSSTHGSTITIENYSKYQNRRRTNGSTNGRTDGNTDGRQTRSKEDKEYKKRPKSAESALGFPEEPETEADVWPERKPK